MWNIETLLPTKTELTQFRVQKYKKVWIYANKIEYFAKSVCFYIILRLYKSYTFKDTTFPLRNGILFGWYIQLYRCAYQIIKGLDKHIA